ncbi:hypothetical protein D9M72_262100 [compost metagenome]
MKLAPHLTPGPQRSPLADLVSVGQVVDVPSVLLGYQKRWVSIKAPLKVGEKSRRIGLTWAEAADNVLTAASATTAGGMNVYYLGYNQDMTIEYIQACAMWARAFNYAAGEIEEGIWQDDEADKNIKTFTITFPSGYRIVALTSRPSNLRGRQGVVVIDEAAFHPDLAELLKAALALLIWGGSVHVISTHNGTDNPFNELIEEIRAGKRKGELFRCTFQEAVNDGLYERVCLRKGIPWKAEEQVAWVADVYAFYGDAANEELDCVPSQGGGTYLSLALLEQRSRASVPVLRLSYPVGYVTTSEDLRLADSLAWCERELAPLLAQLPARVWSFYGMDFARSGDLSVIVPLIQEQDTRKRVPFLVELRGVPFKQQEQILFFIVDRLPHFMAGANDARGNGQQLAESAAVKYGHNRVSQVMLTEGWYRDNMPGLKADLEDGSLYDLPADKDVIADLRAFKLVRGIARIPDTRSSDDQGKRHGDAGIAVALARFASRMEIQQYAYEAVRPANSNSFDDDDAFQDHWGVGGVL